MGEQKQSWKSAFIDALKPSFDIWTRPLLVVLLILCPSLWFSGVPANEKTTYTLMLFAFLAFAIEEWKRELTQTHKSTEKKEKTIIEKVTTERAVKQERDYFLLLVSGILFVIAVLRLFQF